MTARGYATRTIERLERWASRGRRDLLLFTIAVAIWSSLSLVLVFVYARGVVWTGADGIFSGDQLQYLAWIRDAGEHVLSANPFDIAPDPHVYLHPMFLLSGLAWRLGVGLPIAYIVWKPVAVVALAGGVYLFVRRFLHNERPLRRWAAMGLAVSYMTPAVFFAYRWDLGGSQLRKNLRFIGGEAFPAGYLWGYLPSAIAVGLMPIFLLGLERIIDARRLSRRRDERRYVAWASAAGLAVGWLHPWQGLVLLAILGGVTLSLRSVRLAGLLTLPGIAIVLPIGYYFALSEFVPSWAVARSQTAGMRWSVAVLTLGLAPLAVPALRGLRWTGPAERALALWVPAAVIVYLVVDSFPYHAVQGVTIPLAIMAVRSWPRRRSTAAPGFLAVALLTIPGMLYMGQWYRDVLVDGGQPWKLERAEIQALEYVERSPLPGGVAAPVFLGSALPAFTGRDSWVGHPSHTPRWAARARSMEGLLSGALTASEAQSLLRRTGARFLVSDCRSHRDPLRLIQPIVVRVNRFGCATVYELMFRP